MLFDEADQNQFPQCRGRHGLVHVAGADVPPGTSAIVSRCGRTLRGHASPNEFLPPCRWSLPLPPENRSHLAANPFTELIKTRLYLCHPVICYPAPEQLLQLFTDLSPLAASSPAKLLLKVQINRPPGVRRMTFAPSTPARYGSHRASGLYAPCLPDGLLLCGSCSSGQRFAYSFLPTLPHDTAVAVQLGVPVS